MRIMHIDPVKEWRGGQQQVIYLHEGLLKLNHQSVLVCAPDSELAGYCQKKNLPFYTLKMRGEWDISAISGLKKIIKKENPQILHLHSAPAVTLGLYLKLFIRALKLVATRRVDFPVKKPLIGVWKYSNHFLDKIVCISDNIKKVMRRDGVPVAKLEVIHSGIDIGKFELENLSFSLKNEYKIPADHLIIGTVAALVGHKDYPNLINAAGIVLKSFKNVTFCALGDGPDKKDLQGLIDGLGLNDNFKLCGFTKDVTSFLKQLDIFVLASRMEGMGTSVLDAEACGLPVVATKAGGIPEIVMHKKNGILVPPENPAELAGALLALINDQALRHQYGKESKEVVKKFDKKVMIAKNLELYEKLLNGKS
ncbi:MAG: glycosyltransferase family 4 protein [Calditrichaceae bacterium]|nr:glycosyltransferase family 4 protein [Calditrichaceae bacterium]MBN2710350.1 glycosyltransferase family 4 protein [Calditrichaceae bacterium]RQV95100.1 MAG: glycosyltransferase family 1 protein [Calditrichota bacterium]